jgi:predicted N-acetyltransferase YhbS
VTVPGVRRYDHATDFEQIRHRLSAWYRTGDHLPNWHPSRWVYMHSHPNVDAIDLEQFGVAEQAGRIVGIVHQEHAPAFGFLQIEPGADEAITPLLDWANDHLGGWSRTFERETFGLWVYRCRPPIVAAVQDRGYELTDHSGSEARVDLGDPVEPTALPDGYRLATLADENDLVKVNRVLWRGFGHGYDPPDDEIPGRERVQRAPGFRLDRTVVVVAPDGSFASYAGIWLDAPNRAAMVEPVATDPDHRRRGLGRAAVTEALRLVRDDGATHAWVGSDQAFYTSMGFRVTCTADLWLRPS